jgi:hypothetical protein
MDCNTGHLDLLTNIKSPSCTAICTALHSRRSLHSCTLLQPGHGIYLRLPQLLLLLPLAAVACSPEELCALPHLLLIHLLLHA